MQKYANANFPLFSLSNLLLLAPEKGRLQNPITKIVPIRRKMSWVKSERKEERNLSERRGGGDIAGSLSGHAAWLSMWFGWSFKRSSTDELIASDRLLFSASSANQLKHLGLARKECCSAPMTLVGWKAEGANSRLWIPEYGWCGLQDGFSWP